MPKKELTLHIEGLDCPECAGNIEQIMGKVKGVTNARISFATEILRITYNTETTNRKEIEKRIQQLGYKISNKKELCAVPQL